MSDQLALPSETSVPSWQEDLPFERGDTGPGVADLQQRLERLGFVCGDDPRGEYGAGTEAAVSAFQEDRGLRDDGRCDSYTWSSLVEAGFSLGDRLLYRRRPMLHGDDVAALQRRLCALGFDTGRVDGIFGDQTVRALAEFQHNIGLLPDGICGPRTLAELGRLALREGGGDLVSTVREGLRLGSGTLQGRTIAVGEPGGFQSGAAALVRALSAAGASALTFHHPDESEQAEAANLADADCYVGLRLDPERIGVHTVFYRGFRYESETSHHLAELVSAEVSAALGLPDGGCDGMALPILRQTRMPAVVVELGPPAAVAQQTPQLAAAITAALSTWISIGWI